MCLSINIFIVFQYVNRCTLKGPVVWAEWHWDKGKEQGYTFTTNKHSSANFWFVMLHILKDSTELTLYLKTKEHCIHLKKLSFTSQGMCNYLHQIKPAQIHVFIPFFYSSPNQLLSMVVIFLPNCYSVSKVVTAIYLSVL